MSKMRDEIFEQPAAIERTLKEEWSAAGKLRRYLEKNLPRFAVLAARGTSDNAAQFGRYLIEIATGIPVSLAAPSTFTLYNAKVHLQGTLVVGISQSGESTDTNLVIERARNQGAFTVGITNEATSTLAKLAEHVLLVRAGAEKSVAATKTYTGQLTCLYLLASALGADLPEDGLHHLPELCFAALKLESAIRERAERYCFMRQAVCVGRGLNYANSFEFALKLMETCYVVAERFSSADLLHGPIAMIEQSFPAFLFCPAGPSWKPMSELIDKLESVRAEMLPITDQSNILLTKPRGFVREPLVIPAELAIQNSVSEDLYTPIPYVIPAQLFAASLAEVKGLNPDRPRTLTKVTQNL